MTNSLFLVEHNVPDVYIDQSRDFQLVSRLYDLAFQSTRFSIDSLDYISDTNCCNDTILDLIGSKVGFFTNLKLSDSTYRKVLKSFPHIIRHKGSIESIQLILNLFMHISNTEVVMQQTADPSTIRIIFHNYMSDIDLLQQLLEYVRPTGMIFLYELTTHIEPTIDYVLSDNVNITVIKTDDHIVQSVTTETSKPYVGFTDISDKDEIERSLLTND